MVICRNCRSSLPDGTKFCRICGYKISELPIAPFSDENVFSNAPATWSNEEIEQPADMCSEWDDASPTDPSLLVHGDHQPLSTSRGVRQHTQPLDLIHPPLQLTHRERQRTQPMEPIDLQPLPVHGTRQKTQPSSITQLQIQEANPAYNQYLASPPKHPKKAQSGCRTSYRIIAILSLLAVFLAAGTLFFVLFHRSSSNHVTTTTTIISHATLVTSGKAIPGQTLQVVGNHFPPSQIVLVTLDNRPLVKNEATASAPHLSPLSYSMVSLPFANVSGTPITIHTDGTFTVAIYIDTNWKVGSTHHLSVYSQQGKELKSLNLPIDADQLTGQ